jgi:hypothetical protein
VAEELVSYIDFDLYLRSTTVNDAPLKREALDAAHTATWNALGRRVVPVTAGAPGLTARVFRPAPASRVLFLDDFTELTSIVENGVTLVVNTDFVLEPLNSLSASGETVPYDRARRRSTNWFTDDVLPTVTVTARWGWVAVPPQVVEMCKLIGKAYLEGRDFSQGIVVLTETGAFGARETKLVKQAIKDYRSHKTWGVA